MSEVPSGLSIGQILDRVFRLTGAYWRLFSGVAAVPAAAIAVPTCAVMAWWMITIIPLVTAKTSTPPHIPIYFAILFALINFAPIPVFALYLPAGIYAATQANLGVKVTFSQAYSVAWRHYGRYLWLMVLVVLYLAGPLVVFAGLIGGGTALLMMHGAQPDAPSAALFLLIPAAILAYFGFLVYCILIMLRFAVAFPAAVVEDLAARAALRRSTSLTCGARGRIFLVMLVIYAAVYVASMAVFIIFGVIGSAGALAAIAAHVAVGSGAFYVLVGMAALLYLLCIVLYSSFTYAAMNTALAVIYHDQRWRKDGVAPWALPA